MPAQAALRAANQISAMIAYWSADQRCIFANEAYRFWFGRTSEQMRGIALSELLGPSLYAQNLPFIEGVLRGEAQIFERRIPLPGGGARDTIATYTPDIVAGVVQGFTAHVADVTLLRQREAALEQAIAERDRALAEVQVLRGMLPVCSFCKAIRDEKGLWQPMEAYICGHSEAQFTHTYCPDCVEANYGGLFRQAGPQLNPPASE